MQVFRVKGKVALKAIQAEAHNLLDLSYHENIVRYHTSELVKESDDDGAGDDTESVLLFAILYNNLRFKNHPVHSGLFFFHTAEELFFMMMELMEGPIIDIKDPHPVDDLAQCRAWVTQIAAALSVMHSKKMAHRDLKGDNILIKRDVKTGSRVAKVADIGLAISIADQDEFIQAHGALGYCAPEVWDQRGKLKRYTKDCKRDTILALPSVYLIKSKSCFNFNLFLVIINSRKRACSHCVTVVHFCRKGILGEG